MVEALPPASIGEDAGPRKDAAGARHGSRRVRATAAGRSRTLHTARVHAAGLEEEAQGPAGTGADGVLVRVTGRLVAPVTIRGTLYGEESLTCVNVGLDR